MSRIVTLTLNPAIDVSTETKKVVPEHKLRCKDPIREPGGGGINVSRALMKLGGDTVALWTSAGTSGQLLESLLDAGGVPHEAIPVRGITRENLAVFDQATGLQYRFGMPGPTLGEACRRQILERVAQLGEDTRYLVLSGSLPPGLGDDFYRTVIDAVAPSIRVVLDTSGAPLLRALESKLFLVKPNLRELGVLSGAEVESDEQVESAARALLDRGSAEVVVTSLGAGGAIVVTKEHCEQVRSPTVPIRSKVGAGDSMVAGLVLALDQGRAPRDVVRYGVAAGAAAVMTPGSELCTREDTERLFGVLSD